MAIDDLKFIAYISIINEKKKQNYSWIWKYVGYPFCSIVEFRHKDDAEKAIKELHGTEFKGRSIHIREVKPGVHRVLLVLSWSL